MWKHSSKNISWWHWVTCLEMYNRDRNARTSITLILKKKKKGKMRAHLKGSYLHLRSDPSLSSYRNVLFHY
jgi:hypothetical protein